MEANSIDNEIIKKAQNGDIDSINYIITEYKKIISINARKYFIIGADHDDLLQEGTIGLLKALKFYDPSRSNFNTFAVLCIKNQIITAIKASNSNKNIALNMAIKEKYTSNDLDGNIDENIISNISLQNPEDIFISKERVEAFKAYIEDNFSELEKSIFQYMIRGYSYKEIANILSKTPKIVDNTIQRIKKKSKNGLQNII